MLRTAGHGWIGIDVGERVVKLAQLRREGAAWRVGATSAVRRRNNGVDPQNAMRDDVISAALLAEGLRRQPVAATLSMQSCRVEPFDESASPGSNDCWDAWRGSDKTAYALTAPRDRIEALVEVVSAVGSRCEAVDGPPLALARALQMAPGAGSGVLLGGLDWGESTVTFVGAVDGRAAYARTLNTAGFGEARKRVAEKLALEESDVDALIHKPLAATAERRLVHDAVRDAARPTLEDLARTLNHMGGKLRRNGIERLYLFGAGSVVAGLPEIVQGSIGVPTEPFRAASLIRSPDRDGPPDSLIAQAIALSALAWEEAN